MSGTEGFEARSDVLKLQSENMSVEERGKKVGDDNIPEAGAIRV